MKEENEERTGDRRLYKGVISQMYFEIVKRHSSVNEWIRIKPVVKI